jgi:hypothetical protein
MSVYPAWICHECGVRYGRRAPEFATWHEGDACGWCGSENVPVTEPRDFGYPKQPGIPVTRQAGAAIEQAYPFGYRSEDKEP